MVLLGVDQRGMIWGLDRPLIGHRQHHLVVPHIWWCAYVVSSGQRGYAAVGPRSRLHIRPAADSGQKQQLLQKGCQTTVCSQCRQVPTRMAYQLDELNFDF